MKASKLAGVIGATLLLAALAPAAEPAKGKWDVGIRDGYLAGIGETSTWAAARAIGVNQIEVAPNKKLECPNLADETGTRYTIATPEGRKELMQKLAAEKMAICAFCVGHNFDQGKGDDEAIATLTSVAEAAKEMGVPMIMAPVPGGKGMSDEEFIARGKAFLGALVPIAEKTGVPFALENLQLYWNRPEVLLPVIQSLPPNKIGLAHDVTNMYWFGHPVDSLYPIVEQVAPYVRYVHAKNNQYGERKNTKRTPPGVDYGATACSVREGDVDFRRVLAAYAKAGYKGPVTIEDDSLGKHDAAGQKKVLIDDVKFLREVIAEIEKQ